MHYSSVVCMMRVGVSGPGGSGKTTLVASLSPRLSLPIIAEGVWEWIRAERMRKPWELLPEDLVRLQRHVIAQKIAQENALRAFVSDRTTIDAVSLMTLRLARVGQPVPSDLREKALTHAAGAYDVAVLLARPASPVEPGWEHGDSTFRDREYELTCALYESVGVPIIHVPDMPVAEIALSVERALRHGGRR